jgi:signal transduction histidine kinase
LVAAINMIEDITAARQTEMRIKSLSHQLLKAQEDERHQISSSGEKK